MLRNPLAVFVLSALAACGKTEQAAPSPVASEPASAIADEPAEGLEAGADPVEAALKRAREERSAVLVDFHAPWCYSCYYMSRNVLTGAEWEALEKRVVVVELDADSPVGTLWKQHWSVRAMPSYLVLDAGGNELGRLLGEQTRDDFYGRIGAWLDAGDSLQKRAELAASGDRAAASEVLAAYHRRYDATGGRMWFEDLPAEVRTRFQDDPAAAQWLARLELQDAAAVKDAEACFAAADAVFGADLGCETAYELGRLAGCIESAPPAQRDPVLRARREPFRALVEQRVFGAGPACADERSLVLTAADLDETLGLAEPRKALLDRAITRTRERLGENLAADRNRADNLRVYLEAAGDLKALDELMPRLIAAYPDDYVYPFRHGRSLLARGRAAEALPYLEQAAPLAYGINRLQVAEQRVKALQALGREPEAREVVAETLKANGPWFPEEAGKLKALVAA